MVKNISFIVTNSGTISAVANGKSYTVPSDHANYKGIKAALVADDAVALETLANVVKTVTDFTAPVGGIVVKDGQVFWNGEPLNNVVTVRIFDLMRESFPIDPMVNFLSNLMQNPSKRAVEELYKFLEHHGLPLTTDGCFLGYKRVRNDFTDQYSGKFDNSVGKVIEMPRNTVDDEWRTECSSGFHVGCIEYVRGFHAGTGHVMLVKVNPKDVVSVPHNEVTKLRTCKYEVVSEYDRDLVDALQGAVYNTNGTKAAPVYAPGKPDVDVPTAEGCGQDYEDEDDEDQWAEEEENEDEDEDEDDDLTDEEWADELVRQAAAKNINPIVLAFYFDVEKHKLTGNPTLAEVVDLAMVDTSDPEHLEGIIRNILVN